MTELITNAEYYLSLFGLVLMAVCVLIVVGNFLYDVDLEDYKDET